MELTCNDAHIIDIPYMMFHENLSKDPKDICESLLTSIGKVTLK